MKKTAIVFMLILAFALAFTGCQKKEDAGAAAAVDTSPIVIGVAGAHSGDLASYGLPSVNAAELVVEMYNAKGGVLGRQIKLVIEDDQCKEEVASNTAAKVVGEDVVAVIGHICSGATEAALSIYKDSEVIAISPSATKTSLTLGGTYPNFLRTIAHDDAQGLLAGTFIVEELGLKKVAVLHDKGAYGKGFAEVCKTILEDAGVEVVLFEGLTVGAPDYSAAINKIGNSGAEGVVWGGYHPEASKLVTQMRSKGMDLPVVSDDGIKDPTFIEVAKENAEGVYATGPQDTTSNPMAIAAKEAHIAKYGEDYGAFFLNAYAATIAVLNAIEKAGSTDYDKVLAALQSEYVETPLGKISFDEKGDVIGFGFSVFQVKDGVYVEL
ncbi:MAG: branched-chain amino acid ABC transporter substrate-binding protein [Spirochaetales bacterium]|nr:branched-chain amino acid ABC transporter substrate-binding protein [Spirochaetales bacterium]